MLVNKTRERLDQGETAFGCGLQVYRSPEIARTFAAAGFDYVFIDMEHGSFNLETALWVMALGPVGLALWGLASLNRIDRDTRDRAVALAPKVAWLEGLGIFSTASRATLEGLAAAAVDVEFQPSVPIIREGDESDALYVLTEGQVEVSAHGEHGGPERVIRTMSAPTYFGEIGVLEHIPRTASVTALTRCRCERLEGQAFLDALLAAPPSSALIENSRSRLAVTHASRRVTFDLSESP